MISLVAILENPESIFNESDGRFRNENYFYYQTLPENQRSINKKRNLSEMKEYVDTMNFAYDVNGDGKLGDKDIEIIKNYLNDPNAEISDELMNAGFRPKEEIKSYLNFLMNSRVFDINNDKSKDDIDAKIIELVSLLNSLN